MSDFDEVHYDEAEPRSPFDVSPEKLELLFAVVAIILFGFVLAAMLLLSPEGMVLGKSNFLFFAQVLGVSLGQVLTVPVILALLAGLGCLLAWPIVAFLRLARPLPVDE